MEKLDTLLLESGQLHTHATAERIDAERREKPCTPKPSTKVEEYKYPEMKICQIMKTEERKFFTSNYEFPKMTIKADKNKQHIHIKELQ